MLFRILGTCPSFIGIVELKIHDIPKFVFKYLILEGPEYLYYLCLSATPAVSGLRSGRATVRSHVLCTSKLWGILTATIPMSSLQY